MTWQKNQSGNISRLTYFSWTGVFQWGYKGWAILYMENTHILRYFATITTEQRIEHCLWFFSHDLEHDLTVYIVTAYTPFNWFAAYKRLWGIMVGGILNRAWWQNSDCDIQWTGTILHNFIHSFSDYNS